EKRWLTGTGACGVPQSAMRNSDTSAACAGAARPANRLAPSARIVSFRLMISSPGFYCEARSGCLRRERGRVARAGYTHVKTDEMSVYSPDMADLSQRLLSSRFQVRHDLLVKTESSLHDPGRRMPVRRGAVQDGGRADQRPPLPLPQLPEGDGLAVLRPRAVPADRDHGPRRDRPLPHLRTA